MGRVTAALNASVLALIADGGWVSCTWRALEELLRRGERLSTRCRGPSHRPPPDYRAAQEVRP